VPLTIQLEHDFATVEIARPINGLFAPSSDPVDHSTAFAALAGEIAAEVGRAIEVAYLTTNSQCKGRTPVRPCGKFGGAR
jgi:hypothetical protein